MSKVNPWKDQLAMYMLSIGAIEVDDEGRIWKVRNKRKGCAFHSWAWQDIEPKRVEYKQKEGYMCVYLGGMCKQHTILSHRIVWLFHNGLIPKEFEINHKNGDKADNRLVNLELMTRSENVKHGFDTIHFGKNQCRGGEPS